MHEGVLVSVDAIEKTTNSIGDRALMLVQFFLSLLQKSLALRDVHRSVIRSHLAVWRQAAPQEPQNVLIVSTQVSRDARPCSRIWLPVKPARRSTSSSSSNSSNACDCVPGKLIRCTSL